ncbi:MAG: hypothetical protein QOF59_2065, partial [Actinomycetota bacterium]|nr:hypothetical protein [Actinomycetota bacterium]
MCGDCGVALVDSLSPRTEVRRSTGQQQPIAPFVPGDDVVELATLGIVEAELVAAQLRVRGSRLRMKTWRRWPRNRQADPTRRPVRWSELE